ncbi:MAG: hypothetical protein K8H88_27995 [Sandaracinaceae bacterium]|nr:hypothetical protein [Sandaracinaceae bacterium]
MARNFQSRPFGEQGAIEAHIPDFAGGELRIDIRNDRCTGQGVSSGSCAGRFEIQVSID